MINFIILLLLLVNIANNKNCFLFVVFCYFLFLVLYNFRTPNNTDTTHIWVCLEFILKFFKSCILQGCFQNFIILHTPVFNTTSDSILIKFISLDSPRWEDSNDSCFAFLTSILTELCHKMYFYFGI